MTETGAVLALSGEAIAKLSDLIAGLIKSKNVSDAERDAAKAQVAELLTTDEANAQTAQNGLDSLNNLIDLAATALPAE